MDTSTGRFISQDSYAGSISDPTSLHKYLYANSNPVTYSDPSGYASYADAAVANTGFAELSKIIVCNYMPIIKDIVIAVAVASITVTLDILGIFVFYELCSEIASGETTSAEISEEVKDSADDNDNNNSESGGGGSNNDKKNKKNKKNKSEPQDTDKLKWTKKAKRDYKKLSPEQRLNALKSIKDFINGTGKHNNHSLVNDRSGQWALDITGMGKGRGGGRIIYQIVGDVMTITEIIIGHNY